MVHGSMGTSGKFGGTRPNGLVGGGTTGAGSGVGSGAGSGAGSGVERGLRRRPTPVQDHKTRASTQPSTTPRRIAPRWEAGRAGVDLSADARMQAWPTSGTTRGR